MYDKWLNFCWNINDGNWGAFIYHLPFMVIWFGFWTGWITLILMI